MTYITLLIALMMPYSAYSFEPLRMASVGNSLSYSTFAGDGGFNTKTIARRRISWFDKFLFDLSAWPKYSFTTGTKIKSHCMRLNALIPPVECENLSVPGDQVADLFRWQLPEIEKIDFDYLVIEAGANDVAARTTPKEFGYWFKLIMDRVTESNKQIVVVPIPDIPHLIMLKDKHSWVGVKCSTIWQWSSVDEMIVDPKDAAITTELIKEYNKIMKEISASHKNVYYASKLEMFKFEPRHVSRFDCFHSSKAGQELLAELSWPY